jgi:hypothetical protein
MIQMTSRNSARLSCDGVRSAVYVSSRRYAKGSRHAVTAEIHTTRRSRRGAARWLARYCSRPLASAAQVDRRTTGTDELQNRDMARWHERDA